MQLTIITSIYRSEAHLERFLRRANRIHRSLQRSGISFEHLLIINDATELESALTSDLSPSFRVIKVPREPIYATWNRGIKASQGSVICFWNVDDTRFAKAIFEGVKAIEGGVDAVYFPFIYLRFVYLMSIKLLAKVKVFSPPAYDRGVFKTTMHAGPHFMIHRRTIEKNGYFDETYTIAGDFDWWSRFAHTDLEAKRLNSLSGVFTNDGRTLSGSRSQRQQEENGRILKAAVV